MAYVRSGAALLASLDWHVTKGDGDQDRPNRTYRPLLQSSSETVNRFESEGGSLIAAFVLDLPDEQPLVATGNLNAIVSCVSD